MMYKYKCQKAVSSRLKWEMLEPQEVKAVQIWVNDNVKTDVGAA